MKNFRMTNQMLDAIVIGTGMSAYGHPCAQRAGVALGATVTGGVRLIEAKPFPGPFAWSPPS